jgi:hypothetical protein
MQFEKRRTRRSSDLDGRVARIARFGKGRYFPIAHPWGIMYLLYPPRSTAETAPFTGRDYISHDGVKRDPIIPKPPTGMFVADKEPSDEIWPNDHGNQRSQVGETSVLVIVALYLLIGEVRDPHTEESSSMVVELLLMGGIRTIGSSRSVTRQAQNPTLP